MIHAVYPFGVDAGGAASARGAAPAGGAAGAVVGGLYGADDGGATSAGGAAGGNVPSAAGGTAEDGFHSVYYLDGHSGAVSGKTGTEPHVLRQSFFHEFPGFGVRWDVTGGDVYGHGPAYDTLPDSVLLQQMTSSLLKALQKEIDPPLAVPPGLENASLLPGAITPVDPTGAQGRGIYPILQLQHNVRGTYEVILQIQNKVREGLFNNLFRMLLNSDRRQVTAKEIAAREEEKLILIGPVLERLHDEFFIPLSNRTFNILTRNGMLPPPPEDMRNMAVVPEFVSILAQAQKLVSTGGVEQFAMFVGNVARMNPDALDAVDYDAMIDDYAEYLSIEANMLRGQDEREQIRAARQQQQQAMQQQQQAMQQVQMLQAGIGAMKELGQADLGGTALGAAIEHGAGLEQDAASAVQ